MLLVANETGQALQAKYGPKNFEVWKVVPPEKRLGEREGGVYAEALKHLYQSAALSLMKELGVKGLTVADTSENRKQLSRGVELTTTLGALDYDGWSFAWWYALNNSDARQELENTGTLSSQSALKLREEMLADSFNPELEQMIQTAMAEKIKSDFQRRITETSYARLRTDGVIKDVMPGDATYLFVP